MTLNYRLTKEDFYAFNYYSFWERPEKKLTRIRGTFLPLFIFLVMLFISKPNPSDWGFSEAIILLGGVVYALISKNLVFRRIRKRVDKMVVDTRDSKFFETTSYQFTDDEIVSTNTGSQSAIRYDALNHVDETENYLFIYITAVQAFILPKEAVSRTEIDAILDILENHVPIRSVHA